MQDYRAISRSFCLTASPLGFPPSPLTLSPFDPYTMPFVRPYATPTFHSNHLAQVQTTVSVSARRRPVIEVNLGALQRHPRAPSRADSVSTLIFTGSLLASQFHAKLSSETSTSSTLVDGAVRADSLRPLLIALIIMQEAPMPNPFDDEHVMMHLDYMLVSRSALEERHFMDIPSSRFPSTRSAPSRLLHPQVITLMTQCLRRLPLLPSTYYPILPLSNLPQIQQNPDFGSIATSANPPHATPRLHHPVILARNPSLPLYCKRDGPRPKPSSRFSGKLPRVPSLPLVANNAHLLRRQCRAASCAEIHIRSRIRSSRRVRSAVSSSPRNQVSGSTVSQRRSLTALVTITGESPGARRRTRTGTPLSRFRRRANEPKATPRSSSASRDHHRRTPRVPRSVPSSRLRCH